MSVTLLRVLVALVMSVWVGAVSRRAEAQEPTSHGSNTLAEQRASLDPQLLVSGTMTGLGAVGMITGFGLFVAGNGDCGLVGIGCSRHPDDDVLIPAGLLTMLGSALTLVVGAIWLGIVDADRKRLDRMLRGPLSFDVRLSPDGGGIVARVVL